MAPLNQRVALVSGASSGIGRAIALALASTGTYVIAVGRDVARLDELVRHAGTGEHIHPVVCDLGDDDDIRVLSARLKSGTKP
jgi:NADP-dependent 3-hydroxy acid dehydrogenase YdfG